MLPELASVVYFLILIVMCLGHVAYDISVVLLTTRVAFFFQSYCIQSV